ncbi:MAG: hypothetical protein H0X40_11370 [Chthoniobacterales bacterium]|nr:hypothetical protein [Chthoniobacterales bacterium]
MIPPEAQFCAACGKPAPRPDAPASAPKLPEPAPVLAQPPPPPLPLAEDIDPKRGTTEPATKAGPKKARIGRFFVTAAAIICLVFGFAMMIFAPIGAGLKLLVLFAELGLAFAVWKRSRIRLRTLLVLVAACTIFFFVLLGIGASERPPPVLDSDVPATSKDEGDVIDKFGRGELHLIPQNPEDLIGRWKGVGAEISLTVEVTFTEGGFQMLSGRSDEVGMWIHGPYTVDNSSWPMKITVFDGDQKQKRYFAVAITDRDKMDLQEIESPDDPLNADKVSKLLRQQ